ncbi:hypothetical protein D9M71_712520 [compost metagenome]
MIGPVCTTGMPLPSEPCIRPKRVVAKTVPARKLGLSALKKNENLSPEVAGTTIRTVASAPLPKRFSMRRDLAPAENCKGLLLMRTVSVSYRPTPVPNGLEM